MFVFFSDLLGKRVEDASGETIGRLYDLVVAVGEVYPRVEAVVVAWGMGKRHFLMASWGAVAEYKGSRMKLSALEEQLVPSRGRGTGRLLLREEVLDQQIVDTLGAKVVRVNDLHFIRVNGDLRLAHVDIGPRGLLRRLGWLAWIDRARGRLRGHPAFLKDEHFLPWKYVQPLPTGAGAGITPELRLSVPQRQMADLHPADLAEILMDLDHQRRAALFRSLDVETQADALSEVPEKVQQNLIESLSKDRAADVLEEMPPDEAADLLGDLPKEKAERLLKQMEPDEAKDVTELLRHEEDTAGGLMTTEFIAVPPDLTAQRALKRLREHFPKAETISYLYVTDPEGHLLGVVGLRSLISARPRSLLKDFMVANPVRVHVADGADSVAEVTAKYDLTALPVVDSENVMKGIITVDDVLEQVIQEAWVRKRAGRS